MKEKIGRVGIIGGVHGNELTGVYLLKKWLKNKETTRSSFETELITGNPEAIKAGRRFIDTDLNRSFTKENLSAQNPESLEARYAKQLSEKYGPKSEKSLDFLIDLHTTTANMASSIVLINDNPFNLRLSAYLQQNLPDVRIFMWQSPKFESAFVNTLSEKSLTIELGPIAQNVLRSDIFEATEAMVMKSLDFVEAQNKNTELPLPNTVEIFQYESSVDFPKDESGEIKACIHPDLQDQDFKKIAPGTPIFKCFNGDEVLYEGTEETWPVFINEAAYYEKGVAFILTKKVQLPL